MNPKAISLSEKFDFFIEGKTDAKIIAFIGKGGVGKSTLSKKYAQNFKNSLWVTFQKEEISDFKGKVWVAHFHEAFEEYAKMKIPFLGGFFANQSFVKSLAELAPGFKESVLLGKIWYESKNYEKVIIDMPSTGIGQTMFKGLINFASLFEKSPIGTDLEKMKNCFESSQALFCLIATPEEWALKEQEELFHFFEEHFPKAKKVKFLNRFFEGIPSSTKVLGAIKNEHDAIEAYVNNSYEALKNRTFDFVVNEYEH